MEVQIIKKFDDNSGTNLRTKNNPCKLSNIHSFVVYPDWVSPGEDVKTVPFISGLYDAELMPLWSYHQSQIIAFSSKILYL